MEILSYPHPVLRFKTLPLTRVDVNIKRVASAMCDVMKAENGVGLSANQVGLPFRLFVLRWHDSDLCLINPVLTMYGKLVEKCEGCLSFPDVFLPIKRRSKIRFQAWDLNGNDIDEEVDRDLARVVQHEVDHLDGTLFIDRISEVTRNARPLTSHLAGLEKAWRDFPKPFPVDQFRELQYEYCGIDKPVGVGDAHSGP